MDPLAWHQHEMLFGYLGAVIGGFLSAAIPNWTGRPAVTGWRVAVAVGLWLAARLAILFSGTVPPLVGAALASAFLLLLLAYAAPEIVDRTVVAVVQGGDVRVDHGGRLN